MSAYEMILKQSPWLLDKKAIEKDVHLLRLAAFPLIYHERSFLDYPFEDGVYIATGPRQIGKSTHLKMLIKHKIKDDIHENFLYFNCDLLDRKQDIVDVVETYLEKFPSTKRRYLFLDEITSVKDSFLAIKYLIDSGFDRNLTYILTGSNTIGIKKTGEYLPGRRGKGIDFHFKPISFKAFLELLYPKEVFMLSIDMNEKEALRTQKKVDLQKYLDIYLQTGGFPRVINEFYTTGTISDDIFLIYRSWLTSEIAKADKKEYIAKRILERCLQSLSSDISYNAIVQDTGIGSHNTVYDYLEFLESSFVVSQIHCYDLDQKKVQYRKNKKIYFNDPFIYAVIEAWLTGKPKQNYNYLDQPILKSQLVENLVFIKIKELFDEVFYYKSTQEIDFVSSDFLFEVKYQNKVIPDDIKFLEKYNGNKFIITKKHYQKFNNALAIPVELFLLTQKT